MHKFEISKLFSTHSVCIEKFFAHERVFDGPRTKVNSHCMQNCDMPSSISKYLRLKINVKVVNRQRKEKVLVAADSESTSHKHLIRHLFCKRCLFSLGSYHIELIVCILDRGDWNYQCWQWCFHEVCWQWFLNWHHRHHNVNLHWFLCWHQRRWC